MKESEPTATTTTVRSNKKANGRSSTSSTKNISTSSSSSTNSNNKCNGSGGPKSSLEKKRADTAKTVMGGGNSRPAKASNNNSPSSKSKSPGKKGSKQSPELRPRRRASQTYFFKYQLAKNPLKAEEEDLKLALLASLQQCTNGISPDGGSGSNSSRKTPSTPSKKSKPTTKIRDSVQLANNSNGSKRTVARPSKGSIGDGLLNGRESIELNGKKDKHSSSKKEQQYKVSANSTINGNKKRRGSVESNSSSRVSSFKDDEKKKNKIKKTNKHNRQRDDLLASCNIQATKRDSKNGKVRNDVNKFGSLSGCNDLKSVRDRIKKAKKLLQNKQLVDNNNKTKSNNLIGKYSALRKFPSNSKSSMSPTKRQGSSLLSPKKRSDKSKSKTNCYHNNLSTANNNTTSGNPYYIPYSPYTPLQKKEPPDEDYLKKYKPETEDFLTFICFRTTAPNYQSRPLAEPLIANGIEDSNGTTTSINTTNSNSMNFNHHSRIMDNKQVPNDLNNLKSQTTISTLSKFSNNTINSPTIIDHHFSPNNHRRPTRQSPRLASSNRKISENESSNHTTMGTSTTAYDNSITYEEDMKRASIALEDMAHEINSSDNINHEIAQSSPDCISKSSSSPYRNNKHLVKGLMTREFAGAFADEETIFESISNHKL